LAIQAFGPHCDFLIDYYATWIAIDTRQKRKKRTTKKNSVNYTVSKKARHFNSGAECVEICAVTRAAHPLRFLGDFIVHLSTGVRAGCEASAHRNTPTQKSWLTR